jgi:hypothetical protein
MITFVRSVPKGLKPLGETSGSENPKDFGKWIESDRTIERMLQVDFAQAVYA